MNLVELAQRIRSLRIERGLTLDDVADHCGQTRSWLSRVENFRITPSLSALGGIASALGVTTSSLLQGIDEKPEIIVSRRGEGVLVNRDADSAIKYRSLASNRSHRTMDPFLLTVPAGEDREPRSHEGEEFLLVLKGKVTFRYGDQEVKLSVGDSLYFDSETEHCLGNPYSREAAVLCVYRLGRK